MSDFNYEVGNRIRTLREVNRYTREEFAEIANISPKFLYEIETGQKGFSAEILYKIAKGLSVSCDYILAGEDNVMQEQEIVHTLRMYRTSQRKILKQIVRLIYEISVI